jgi:hypothetical protein
MKEGFFIYIYIEVGLLIACICLDVKTWEAGNAQKRDVAKKVRGRGDDSLSMSGIESI